MEKRILSILRILSKIGLRLEFVLDGLAAPTRHAEVGRRWVTRNLGLSDGRPLGFVCGESIYLPDVYNSKSISVTAPSDADVTWLAYFASTPRV